MTIRSRARLEANKRYQEIVALNTELTADAHRFNHDTKPQLTHEQIMANLARK